MGSERSLHPPSKSLRLQEGIYWTKDDRPGRSYRLLLLDVKPNTTPGDARVAIASVWAMLQRLRDGVVGDLQPTRAGDPDAKVCPGELTCLIGYGARLFEHTPPLTPCGARPAELMRLRQGLNQPYPSLHWAEHDISVGEADLALQFVAETELAVTRASLEVHHRIEDANLPLRTVALHGGFNRDDRRSWLGFHDGISNIKSTERLEAIQVGGGEPPWMEGGTYMVFLRLALDLRAWRRFSREEQEILVGRDKLSGCPLATIDSGYPVPVPGCPLHRTPSDVVEHNHPSPTNDPRLWISHVHRANATREGPQAPASNRIFRQGYEFLESLTDGHLRAGLNFVSFQRALAHFTNIVTRPAWLGMVNFGGPPDRDPVRLASVVAGGYYAVPARAQPFPGAEIFGEDGASPVVTEVARGREGAVR